MNLLRAGVATLLVVLIAAATVLIIQLDANRLRLVVHAEINPQGEQVRVSDAAPADPAGNGTAVCPPVSIAVAGAFTGTDTEVSIGIRNGVQLAIEKHNSANPGCQVQLKEFDTGGDPARVSGFAPQIVADAYTTGLIGPTFSGIAEATGDLFEAEGLPAATASASRSTLSAKGWSTFFRGVTSDEVQGWAVAAYMKNILKYNRICVISDGSPYGDAIAQVVRVALGNRALSDCAYDRIKAASPDVVLRTGSYADAPGFLRRLRDAGVTVPFISAQGVADESFVGQAGSAARGATVICPCGPDPQWFRRDYRSRFRNDPGAYSAEGYDLATIMLKGIDAGMLIRPQMLDWMQRYSGQGVARRYEWTTSGELKHPTTWIFKVQ
jgi:branched-chain amino acid transport system substrate-binding protein